MDPSVELQAGIFRSLESALDGVEVIDGVAQGQTLPYVVIGEDDLDDDSNGCGAAYDCLSLIHCHADGQSRNASKVLAAKVKLALEQNPVTVDGFIVTSQYWEGVSLQAEQGGRRHRAIVRFRVKITEE